LGKEGSENRTGPIGRREKIMVGVRIRIIKKRGGENLTISSDNNLGRESGSADRRGAGSSSTSVAGERKGVRSKSAVKKESRARNPLHKREMAGEIATSRENSLEKGSRGGMGQKRRGKREHYHYGVNIGQRKGRALQRRDDRKSSEEARKGRIKRPAKGKLNGLDQGGCHIEDYIRRET